MGDVRVGWRSHICLQLERLTPREARITDGDARCIAVSTPSLPSPCVKRVSQRSAESRGFSPGAPVSSNRESWQGGLG
jgi:hypothetical protein